MNDDLTIQAVQIALDGLSLREQMIGHNIANADTPGFRARTVAFEAQLQRVLDRNDTGNLRLATTRRGHLKPGSAPDPTPRVVGRANTALRIDDNNVDVDLEMTQLAETNIQYQALTQLMSRKLALLKLIIAR